jgi:flagellar motor switch protein FliN/FliY
MTASLIQEMFLALVEELGIVVGATIDTTATVSAGVPATGRQWVGEIRAEGEFSGTVTVVLDHAGAAAITRLMTGIEGDIPDEAVLDTIREVLAQAVSALSLKPVARGAKLSVVDVTPGEGRVPESEWNAHSIASDKMSTPLSVTTWGNLTVAQAAPAKPASGPRPVPQSGKGAAKEAVTPAPEAKLDDRIDVILDIDLPLVVRFGRTELPLKALTRLGPGSVIDLGRSPDDPVEVLVSNRVVARGEVVIVSGSYGIRIIDVVSQRERVRSMEA